MSSFCRVTILGNLGRDPEVRDAGGTRVVSFSVATSERWKDRNGEQQDRTTWHNVSIWNEKLGEIAERFLTKGRPVLIEGTLQTRKYTDKDGVERTVTDVVVPRFAGSLVLLGGRDDQGGGQGGGRPAEPAPSAPRGGAPAARSVRAIAQDLDDDIPF
jgi:single-strand DNA-binding protein